MTFAQIAIIAAEEAEHAEDGGLALLLPETNELVAGIIAFGIVFFFVWKWAIPAINKGLEQRQAAIGGQLTEAEKAKAEAESLLADYRAQLAGAKSEGNKIVDEARAAGEQLKADIVSRAESEANQIVAKAREEADNEKDRALADARREVGEISVDLAGKIVGQSLDADSHKELVERYLADLERM